ncbi:MAG: metallopeptidase TldD-related protein [Acidobacteriaceae bacterium]|jgi:predicted Zn-dependent protease
MKKQVIALTLFVLASAPLVAQQDDVESRAMRDEMQRSMKDLRLESMECPYYIAYKIVDSDRMVAHASLGSLTSSGESRNRSLSVTVRVGSYDLDNSNFIGGIGGMAELIVSLGNSILPIDDNYDELRRKIWLATDAAYKKAVEDLSAKKAARLNSNYVETVPDFSREPARQESETLPPIVEKLSDAERLVRDASAIFLKLRSVETSEAEFEVDNGSERFLNSEGTTYFRQVPEVYFHASASLQNSNGETFTDMDSEHGRSLSGFPSEATVLQNTQEIADRLTARLKGKSAKRYNGPVLVEGKAADELFAAHFANQLSARHSNSGVGSLLALLSGNASSQTSSNSSMLNKVGSRVLPDFLTVVDNPQLSQSDGQPLFGNYKFDEEGVPSQETVLVENGILKRLLTSRAPVRGMLQSTGNMRELGVLPGNLFVNASKSSSHEELRKQLIDLVTSRGLEYGMILRRFSGTTAIEAARVYPDGHEESVRDARISDVSPSSFKDILAVSKDRTVYTTHASATSLVGLSSLANADLITYIVPDLLFEDMTVEHTSGDTPKPPAIPSPLASN